MFEDSLFANILFSKSGLVLVALGMAPTGYLVSVIGWEAVSSTGETKIILLNN